MNASITHICRLSILIAVGVLITMVQQGCESPEPGSEPEPESAATALPSATPEGIWKYISEDEPYVTWSLFPSDRIPPFSVWKGEYLRTYITGSVAKIYVNDVALGALDEEPRDMPNGSIIIAELHALTEDENVGEPTVIAGFYKVEGSTARDNDWVSFGCNPDGSIYPADYGPMFGTKTACYSCHEAAENDYIWIDSPRLDAELTHMPSPEESKPRP